MADGEYILSQPGQPLTALAPDVAFVRADRAPVPGTPEWDAAWHLAPDLAVDVATPNQYRPEVAEKARRYIHAGVQLVWIVWPRYRQVDVWRPGSQQPVSTLTTADFLDGVVVLPGFTYPIANLFV